MSLDNQDNKRKGGRPQKSFTTLKSKTVGVCFSEVKLNGIRQRALQANLPLSIYCHDAILNGVIKETINKEDMKVLKGLVNTGNNLNQLMKTVKFLNLKHFENETLIVLKQIQNVIDKLSDDWKNSKRKKL